MPNTRALQDVLDSEYSSEADKATASAALYRIANPDRPTIVPVDLTATVQPIAEPKAEKPNVSIDRIGLLISGIGYTDPAEGWPEADIKARARCPEFDGDVYRAKQRQDSHNACLCTAASQQDSDNRMATIIAANPTWDRIRVMREYAAQDESHTKFVLVDNEVEKRKYDDQWATYVVVPIAVAPSAVPVAVPVVVAVPSPIPMRELSEENKRLVAEARRDLEMRQLERKMQAMREAKAQGNHAS